MASASRSHLGGGALDQRGLQHQVLGRIADQLHLGKDDQIAGPGLLRAPSSIAVGIAGEVADLLVELGKGDGELVGHGRRYRMRAGLLQSRGSAR